MSDSVVLIEMDPFVERFQPDQVELWRTGSDVRPHPDDGVEMKLVWRKCEDLLARDNIDVTQFNDQISLFAPRKVKKYLEGQEEPEIELIFLTAEEKREKIKRHCQKQIQHFVKYRDILPEIKDLFNIEYSVLTDSQDYESDKENIETEETSEREIGVSQKMLTKASKVKVRMCKEKFLKDYVDRLPRRKFDSTSISKKPKKSTDTEAAVVKKHGFADLSSEEIEAKRSMKKCTNKHKLWPCRKCSGCIREDCAECMFCLDKPKFGGHNIMKQKCIHKKCSNPIIRSCDKCTWNL